MHRLVGLTAFLFVLACLSEGRTGFVCADEQPSDGLPEGWKSIVTIPEVRFKGILFSGKARLKLWNERGWLVVRRETADGDFDWQVILAKATSAEKPKTSVSETGVFTMTYRDFFIREGAFGKLRIYREPKKADDSEWPVFETEVDPNSSSGTASGGPEGEPRTTLAFWEFDGWAWVQAGTIRDRPDLWLRFHPKTMTFQPPKKEGGGWALMTSSLGAPAEIQIGTAFAFDDGDFFIAERAARDRIERGLDLKAGAAQLGIEDPPALVASGWLNSPEPVVLANLEKQVVLLGFWSEHSPSSVGHLKRMQVIDDKFKARGIVVVGIYVGGDSKQATSIVEDKAVTFPVMFDQFRMEKVQPRVGKPGGRQVTAISAGETTRSYLVDILPTYFLIDRSGKLAQGYGMAPPTDEQIEALLK